MQLEAAAFVEDAAVREHLSNVPLLRGTDDLLRATFFDFIEVFEARTFISVASFASCSLGLGKTRAKLRSCIANALESFGNAAGTGRNPRMAVAC